MDSLRPFLAAPLCVPCKCDLGDAGSRQGITIKQTTKSRVLRVGKAPRRYAVAIFGKDRSAPHDWTKEIDEANKSTGNQAHWPAHEYELQVSLNNLAWPTSSKPGKAGIIRMLIKLSPRIERMTHAIGEGLCLSTRFQKQSTAKKTSSAD